MTPLARFFEFADARRAEGEEFPVPEGWHHSEEPWTHEWDGEEYSGWCRTLPEPCSPLVVSTATALDYRAACDCVVEYMCGKDRPVSVHRDSGKVWSVAWYTDERRYGTNPCKLTALLDAAGEVER